MVGVVVVLIVAFIGSLLMLVAWAKGHLRHGLKGYPHEGVAMMAFRPAKPGSLWDRWSQRSRKPSTNNS
jgi:hypothetical protein